MFDLRRPAVDAQDGDVRAVHGTAHVQAAGQGDAQLAGQLHLREVLVQVVHHALDDAGGVGGRRVAVHPALRVDDVRDRVADAAHRVAELLQVGDQRIDLGLVGEQELDVVAAGEAQVAAAVLVGQVREVADAS